MHYLFVGLAYIFIVLAPVVSAARALKVDYTPK